jgi:hypothetical protein
VRFTLNYSLSLMARRSRIYLVTEGVSRKVAAREYTDRLFNQICKRRFRFGIFPGQNALMLRP